MSSNCQKFIENGWRKGVCSHCFRSKEQHNSNMSQSQYHFGSGSSQITHDNEPLVGGIFKMDSASTITIRKPQFNVGGPVGGTSKSTSSNSQSQKGILKSNTGLRKEKKRGVSFPKDEIVEVIGYGDQPQPHPTSDSEESEDNLPPPDPQDNASIAELLEKNSTTLDEKEFYRLTQKNTNFNSIKTNLLGKTNIEIGPIVGGTKGSLKPLVSIGTFEMRHEPLQIRKKIDEDTDLSEGIEILENYRKFVLPKTTLTSVPGLNANVSETMLNLNPKPKCQSVTIGSTLKTKTNSPPLSQPKFNLNPNPNPNPKTSSVTFKTPTDKDSSDSSSKKSQCIKPTKISITSTKDQSPKNEIQIGIGPTSKLIPSNPKPAIKPKSILIKSTPDNNNKSPVTTSPTSNLPPIISNKSSELKALNNLIILTEGNSNTIASKRTSFLQDIIKQPSSKDGVTVVSTECRPSLEENKDSLESPINKIKPDFASQVTNIPSGVITAFSGTGSSGTGTDSEFDDSLEDSGLDKAQEADIESINSEESSSYDKLPGPGSGSDSGNENDYTVSNDKCSGRVKKGHKGLYISVEEEVVKPQKLSPDSVLNEMEGSVSEGSNESIPELLEQRKLSQVSFTKRQAPQPPSKTSAEEEEEEEELYDDVMSIRKSYSADDLDNNDTPKTKIGSYSFQTPNTSDDHDPVPIRSENGIEFIGIRKIDADSFLKERSPTPDRNSKFGFRRSSSRERSSSTSPKTRRKGVKVNQFFSTIGKKAGAAFNNSQNYLGVGGRKDKTTPSVFGVPSQSQSQEPESSTKRSLSNDEVSVSRASEIYATLTPSSLKLRGVLNKLSKIDLNLGDKHKQDVSEDYSDSSSKKNHNISKSIKKFLRFGSKDNDLSTFNSNQVTSEPMSMTSTTSGESSTLSFDMRKPPSHPPPPPPRIHSLDMIKISHTNQKGTVKPARPPPPVRINQVAPSFMAVFNTSYPVGDPKGLASNNKVPSSKEEGKEDEVLSVPPNKPRRRSSNKDLETSIVNLNLETLKLISKQPLAKITSNFPIISSNDRILRFTDFDLSTGMRPESLLQSQGVAIYPAHYQGTKCLLMIQESHKSQNPFQLNCVQTDYTFQDEVPYEYCPWGGSGSGSYTPRSRKAIISVLPNFKIWNLEDFVKSSEIPKKEKYLALLQSLEYWECCEIQDLLVLKQPHITSCDRIYVHATPTKESRGRSRLFGITNFLLNESEAFLSKMDRLVLQTNVNLNDDKDQALLFFQLKLFSPLPNSFDFHKIKTHRNEESIQQWLDKERALVMKEAVERSLTLSSLGGSVTLDTITPLKKAYLNFLMRDYQSAKNVLELILDLSN